jgi:hypothetical protein
VVIQVTASTALFSRAKIQNPAICATEKQLKKLARLYFSAVVKVEQRDRQWAEKIL